MRLMCVDTEECQIPRGNARHYKPVTYGGRESFEWLKDHLGVDARRPPAPRPESHPGRRVRHRRGHHRRLPQAQPGELRARSGVRARRRPRAGENLSLAVVRAGRSPYFTNTAAAGCTTRTFSRLSAWRWRTSAGSGASLPPSVSARCPSATTCATTSSSCPGGKPARASWRRAAGGNAKASRATCWSPACTTTQRLEAASRGATVTVFVDLQPKDPFMILGIMRNVSYAAADGGVQTGRCGRRHGEAPVQPVDGPRGLGSVREDQGARGAPVLERRAQLRVRHGRAFMYHKKHVPQLLLASAEQIADAPSKDAALHHAGERTTCSPPRTRTSARARSSTKARRREKTRNEPPPVRR